MEGLNLTPCSYKMSYVSLVLRNLGLFMFHPGNVSLYFHPLKNGKNKKCSVIKLIIISVRYFRFFFLEIRVSNMTLTTLCKNQ